MISSMLYSDVIQHCCITMLYNTVTYYCYIKVLYNIVYSRITHLHLSFSQPQVFLSQ